MHVRGLPVFVWSVDGGGDGGEPPASPEPKEGSGDPADLGDAGKRAIAAERAARTEAEKRATAAEAEVEKYRKATETEAERQARERAYAAVGAISWDGAHWRKDIGARAL